MALALLLALMAVAQPLLPFEVMLPAEGPVARLGTDRPFPAPPPIARAAAGGAATMFAPAARAVRSADAAAAPADPLAGTVIAGMIRTGPRAYAVVRDPRGGIRNVPLGGRIAGWQLVALEPDSARLARDGRRIALPFGAAAIAAPPVATSGEDQ